MTSRQFFVRSASVALVLMTAASTVTMAGPAQGPLAAKREALATIPVRVEVTFSRYQGDKKISSLPFALLASAVDPSAAAPSMYMQNVSMRMGIDVPIGSTTKTTGAPAAGGTQSTGTASTTPEYRNVGTNIDCRVNRLDDRQFSVFVNISDSSIYSPDGDTKSLKNIDPAAFRTFSTQNTVVLREGQTVMFGTGTDKISGETLKVEVTLTVVK